MESKKDHKISREKKLKKKERDDDKPKKPLGAYFLFEAKKRDQFKRDNPGKVLSNEKRAVIRKEWQEMNEEMKIVYKREFDKLLKVYQR